MFGVTSASVVAGLGAGLMEAAPSGPGQPVGDGVQGVDGQLGEQTADLVDGQGNQFRVGGLGSGVFPGGDHGQDGVGEHDQGGVPVPGVPTADLVFVQSGGVLAGLKAGLHAPAGAGNTHEGG